MNHSMRNILPHSYEGCHDRHMREGRDGLLEPLGSVSAGLSLSLPFRSELIIRKAANSLIVSMHLCQHSMAASSSHHHLLVIQPRCIGEALLKRTSSETGRNPFSSFEIRVQCEVRGHLHIAATLARQAPGTAEAGEISYHVIWSAQPGLSSWQTPLSAFIRNTTFSPCPKQD